MLRQSYETTLIGKTGQELHFFVLPKGSIKSGSVPSIEDVVKDLGIQFRGAIDVTPSTLAYALTALLSDNVVSSDPPVAGFSETEKLKAAFFGADRDSNFRFAERAAYERVVPFEASPLGKESLGNILSMITGGTAGYVGAKLGVAVVLAVNPAATPVLILSGAAVGLVVVCGAKAGFEEFMKAIGRKFAEYMGSSAIVE